MALRAMLVEAINSYTGLTPAAFFTILALMVGVYRLVSGMFVAPETEAPRAAPMEPVAPAEPVQMGDVTLEELRAYDGSDPKKPLLMAIKGQIYDVSTSRYASPSPLFLPQFSCSFSSPDSMVDWGRHRDFDSKLELTLR